jgi:hypothetical protein
MMDSGLVCEEHPWPAVGRPFTLVPVALLGTCRNGPIRRFELGHSFRLGRDRLRDLRDGIGAGLGHAIRLAVIHTQSYSVEQRFYRKPSPRRAAIE